MNPDFWRQFADAPRIDCVKMKHDIQAQIYEETKGMTWEQRLAYYRQDNHAPPPPDSCQPRPPVPN